MKVITLHHYIIRGVIQQSFEVDQTIGVINKQFGGENQRFHHKTT